MLDGNELEVLEHARTRNESHELMVKCLVLGASCRTDHAPLFDRDMTSDANQGKKLTMYQLRLDEIDERFAETIFTDDPDFFKPDPEEGEEDARSGDRI